jgi:hypothetical protein
VRRRVCYRVVAILIYLLDTNLIPRRSHLLAFMVCNYSLLNDFENIKLMSHKCFSFVVNLGDLIC